MNIKASTALKIENIYVACANYDWPTAKTNMKAILPDIKPCAAKDRLKVLIEMPLTKMKAPIKLPDCLREHLPRHSKEQIFIDKRVDKQIKTVLNEYGHREALEKASLVPVTKILFHGPSGTGKTSLAHVLADELGMRLCIVSHAQIIDSHLGETSKNVDQIIKYIEANECVMLFDEFDSIAKKRDHGGQDIGEMARITNMLLSAFDDANFKGLFIACTNVLELIDTAMIRRFEMLIHVDMPSRDNKRLLVKSILGEKLQNQFDKKLNKMNMAELSFACIQFKKRKLLKRLKL